MTDLATREPAPRSAPTRSAWHDGVRVALLIAWLVLLASVLMFGERQASLSQLRAAVTSGGVDTVRVSPGLGPGQMGNMTQEAHWREGWRRYVVRVNEVNGSGGATDNPLRVISTNLRTRLRHENPDIRILSYSTPDGSATEPVDMLARKVPQWVNYVRLLLAVSTLLMLINGPEPWRATRWAWFWFMALFGLETLGVLAFLALSGPTPMLAAPKPGRRRLTGGKAFVVALLLSGLGVDPS